MKKIVALLLIMASLLTSVCFTVSAKEAFSDVPYTHWAYDYVSEMVARGIVKGYEDGTYRPGNKVSRGEWAKLLVATADIDIYDNYEKILESIEDVNESDWYASYAVTVMPYLDFTEAEKGGRYIVSFEPNRPATRLEITKSIVKERGYDIITPDESLINGFADFSSIPEADKKYVAAAVKEGIIAGFNDNTFRPFDSLTRAEAATMLYRAYIKDSGENESSKPYRMSTLVPAEMGEDESVRATLDDHRNLYYIDAEDNCVYKINLDDRVKTFYFDPNDLEGELGEASLSAFKGTQVFWDEKTGTLLLAGMYTGKVEPGKAASNKEKIFTVYNISDNTKNKLLTITDDYGGGGDKINIQAVLNNKYLLVYCSGYYKLDTKTGETTRIYISGYGANDRVRCRIYGNDIFDMDDYDLHKYDYTSNAFSKLYNIDDAGYGNLAAKNGCYYFYSKDWKKPGEMYKLSLKDFSVTTLDINLNPEKVDVTDMAGFDKLDDTFYVADDETMVFYDHDICAYRILEAAESKKTTINIEEFFYKYERQ